MEEEIKNKIIRLIEILTKEKNSDFDKSSLEKLSYEETLNIFYDLLIGRDDSPFNSEFLKLQDEVLDFENKKNKAIDSNDLKYKNNIAIYWGNLTEIKADAVVNFFNEKVKNTSRFSLKNQVLTSGGLQIKLDFNYLLSRNSFEMPNIIFSAIGHKLLTKNIIHCRMETASKVVSYNEKILFCECIKRCLDFANEKKYSSLIFTLPDPEFGYSKELSANILIETVLNWFNQNGKKFRVVICALSETNLKILSDTLIKKIEKLC